MDNIFILIKLFAPENEINAEKIHIDSLIDTGL